MVSSWPGVRLARLERAGLAWLWEGVEGQVWDEEEEITGCDLGWTIGELGISWPPAPFKLGVEKY